MADLRINTSTPTLPSPQAQPNAIDALSNGVVGGISLGFAAQQHRALQEKLALEQQKQQDERFTTALNYLTDKKFTDFLTPEAKVNLFKTSVIPVLNDRYGLHIDPSSIQHDNAKDGPIENLLMLVKNGASPEIIRHEYMVAISHSDKKTMPALKEFQKNYLHSSDTNPILDEAQARAIMGGDPNAIVAAFPEGVPSNVLKTGVTTFDRNVAPTVQQRSMGEMAGTLLPHIKELRGTIHEAAQKGYIGPVAGRIYGQFLAGKVGTTGDETADRLLGKLRAQDSLVKTAMIRTHFGARGGQAMYDHFGELLNSGKQSEAVLNGALDSFDSFARGYAQSGGVDLGNQEDPMGVLK